MVILAPGCDAALRWGCLCPVAKNWHGAGLKGGTAKTRDGRPVYAIHRQCPIHAALFLEGTD